MTALNLSMNALGPFWYGVHERSARMAVVLIGSWHGGMSD
jgi:hypothetical protein